jgi:peptidoglycan/LPS O-acetylase OafA/YrhL
VLVSARFLLGYGTKLSLLIEGLGSAYLIGALAYGRRTSCHAILRKSWARFLGRISYSFYLYHPLALACFAPIILRWSLDPFVTAGLIAVTTIVVTLPISLTSFIAVELPFMRLGRFMEGRTERFFRKRRLSDVPAHLPARA